VSEWRTARSAPKDKVILVFGKPEDLVINGMTMLSHKKPGCHTAYWDEIDNAFVLTGGSYYGPFIRPTHWMPLPEAP